MNLANMKRSETTEQIALFNWARANEDFIPELKLLHHVPNEGKRSNGPVMKAAGLKTGVPDLCLPVARRDFIDLIDPEAINREGGEYEPFGPVAESAGAPFMLWGNNTCYLMAGVRLAGQDKEEAEFWKHLEGTEII